MKRELEAVKAALAPDGTLRVGLNHSNFLLVKPGSSADEPAGVAADIARELGKRLGAPVNFSAFDAPAKLADAVNTSAWSVAFLAAEPSREKDIAFTPAYVEIESTYLVPAGSPIRSIAEVDQPGVRISVVAKSAYELWLSRNIKHAELVMAANLDESFQLFLDLKLEVLSGLKPRLVTELAKLPGARILEGRFTAVRQAIGIARGDAAAAAWLRDFVEDIKQSGLVARLLVRHDINGLTVATAAG